MHSDAIWSWNCWGNFKSKDSKWCMLTLFDVFLGWNCLFQWNRGQWTVHTDTWKTGIPCDFHGLNFRRTPYFLDVIYARTSLNGCPEFELMFWKLELLEMLIARTPNDVFSCSLKCSWNCWENFEIKDAKQCILTLFETMFLFFKPLIIKVIIYARPRPSTSTFLLLFSYLKVIFFWLSIQMFTQTNMPRYTHDHYCWTFYLNTYGVIEMLAPLTVNNKGI